MSGITQRIGQLRDLHGRLARHHFGLEREIHRLQQAVAPWYLFPGTQARPRVIGLWGMTGTGKSTLVRNLVRELGLEDVTFWLDAGDCHGNYWLDTVFGRMEEHMNGKPFVVVVDEFQHAAMRDPRRHEPGDLRRFWEFLDAGRVVTWPRMYLYGEGIDLHDRIAAALQAGARVLNGRVVEGHERYQELVIRHCNLGTEAWDHSAIPASELSMIRDMFPEPRPSMPVLEAMLEKMDGPAMLGLFRKLRVAGQRPNVVDARQALVLVLGNLDELYSMGREPLAELHPDVLVRRHEDIGTAGIQHALLRMFRIEQVARLGNDHVIFPPLPREIGEQLVRHEVEALLARIEGSCGSTLHVAADVIGRIGRNTGPAVLGARPMVEAVQRILPALFAQVLQWHTAVAATRIELLLEDDRPLAVLDGTERIGLQWPVEEHDAGKVPAEVIERIAVHEAGHVLCGRMLCGMKALQVCVQGMDQQLHGFVIWDKDERTMLRREIVPQLARMLGGLVAEKWKYGSEALSAGSPKDLQEATVFALAMVKEYGMGRDHVYHKTYAHAEGPDGFRSATTDVDAQVRQWMEEAEHLALATLDAHAPLMHRLVAALVERRSLVLGELDGVFEGVGDVEELTSD